MLLPTEDDLQFPDWTDEDVIRSGGRDFLGLQSVGQGMTDELMPGLTNQTKHPRYYSFFAWVFSRAEQARVPAKELDDYRFRYETALVYSGHAGHERGNFSGIVGNRSMKRGTHAWIDQYTKYAITSAHWKNGRVSAFSAPYYAPSCELLGVLRREGSHVVLSQTGQALASAYETALTDSAEIERLHDPRTKWMRGTQLAQLHDAFCPCAIRRSRRAERVLLIDLLFRLNEKRSQRTDERTDLPRRLSLAYLLSLVDDSRGKPWDEDTLRALIYYWRYPGGRRHQPSQELRAIAEGWRIFQARQYQRYGIEALWAVFARWLSAGQLDRFEISGLTAQIARDLDKTNFFSQKGVALKRSLTKTTLREFATGILVGSDVQAALAKRMLNSGTLDVGTHLWDLIRPPSTVCEDQWKRGIQESLFELGNPAWAFGNAAGLLVTTWLRWRCVDPAATYYGHFLKAGGRHRVSLRTMFNDLDSQLDSPLSEVFTWLLEEYAIGQHLKFAIEKLRIEGIDTFWFYSDETGYYLHPDRDAQKAVPTYNAPKLWAALSCLYDLRLVDRSDAGGWRLTDEGRRLVDRLREAVQGNG